MIEYLKGAARKVGANGLVVDVGGVGVRVLCSETTINQTIQSTGPVTLFTSLLIRENSPPELFGFFTETERMVFDQLQEVKGVSGRIALGILSKFDSESVVLAIADQNHDQLQTVSGVGRKLAERIVTELRDKIASPVAGSGVSAREATSLSRDAVSGLVSLGYKNAEAQRAVIEYLRSHPKTVNPANVIQNILKSR